MCVCVRARTVAALLCPQVFMLKEHSKNVGKQAEDRKSEKIKTKRLEPSHNKMPVHWSVTDRRIADTAVFYHVTTCSLVGGPRTGPRAGQKTIIGLVK